MHCFYFIDIRIETHSFQKCLILERAGDGNSILCDMLIKPRTIHDNMIATKPALAPPRVFRWLAQMFELNNFSNRAVTWWKSTLWTGWHTISTVLRYE